MEQVASHATSGGFGQEELSIFQAKGVPMPR